MRRIYIKQIFEKIKSFAVCKVSSFFKSSSQTLKRKYARLSEYIEHSKYIRNKNGVLNAVKFVFVGDNNTKRFKKSLAGISMMYIAPVMSAVLLFNVVISAAATDYCVAVNFGGDTVAYVQSETVYNEAEALLKSRILSEDCDGKEILPQPELMAAKNLGYNIADTKELADILISYASDELTTAYGVYSGNEFITAVYDKSEIETFVSEYLKNETSKYPDAETQLANEILYIDGLYLKSGVDSVEKAEEKLFDTHNVTADYTVEKGDTVELLAKKFGMDKDEFQKLNSTLTKEKLVKGKVIKINFSEPYLSTVCVRNEVVTEEIPFETVTLRDSTRLVTDPGVIKEKGEEGSKDLTYNVVTRNGIELSKTLLSEKVTKEPVTQKVAFGTLIKIKIRVPVINGVPQLDKIGQISSGANSTATAGVGGYIWPVGNSGGYVSCYFGGSKGHTGLDIAAPIGTPIYAAADGTVVRVIDGTTGYGKYIVVQNDDGLLTYYAHCNFLSVMVGQRVSQGQFIAEVGSTGNSTGPHLHFEVRSGSTYLDPIDFVK